MSEGDHKYYICRLCPREIPCGETRPEPLNITNLIRHLKVGQMNEYDEFSKLADSKEAH